VLQCAVAYGGNLRQKKACCTEEHWKRAPQRKDVLHCVAVCCSALQYVAVSCSVLQCIAVYCCVLLCVVVCCSVLQIVVVWSGEEEGQKRRIVGGGRGRGGEAEKM